MFIEDANEIFFLDRDNAVFQVSGLTFPHGSDLRRHLKDTLLDGVSFYFYIYVFFNHERLYLKEGRRCRLYPLNIFQHALTVRCEAQR